MGLRDGDVRSGLGYECRMGIQHGKMGWEWVTGSSRMGMEMWMRG